MSTLDSSHFHQGPRVDIGPQEFRSGWEANIARLLTFLGIKWEYEPKRFFFPGGIHYLPDFHLKSSNPWDCEWLEVKGLWRRGDKAKCKCFMIFYADQPLHVIVKQEYTQLEKKYGHLIPNWEWSHKRRKKCSRRQTCKSLRMPAPRMQLSKRWQRRRVIILSSPVKKSSSPQNSLRVPQPLKQNIFRNSSTT